MREFDLNGLRLAEFQGKIFEESVDYFSTSSSIFLRRFKLSNLVKRLDENDSSQFSLYPMDALKELEEEFPKSSYGKTKFSKEVMFWMGYLYRYISYTRDINTPYLFNLFDYKQLKKLYYVYHTQSMEYVVTSLLEMNNLSEDIFDKNKRLKMVMLKDYKMKKESQLNL